MATPVTYIIIASIVNSEESCIGDIDTSYRIGIEIVVDMQSVHVITCQNIADHLADEVAILLDGRIQQCQTIVVEATLRIAVGHMIAGQRVCRLGFGTIGINPCVQLHIALMTLLYHPLQRVPIRLGRPTLLARQIVAPRLQLTLIECIALRAHLEDDGITTILLQFVQLVAQRLLHLLCGHTLKLSVDTLYPGTTELALGLRPCGASE